MKKFFFTLTLLLVSYTITAQTKVKLPFTKAKNVAWKGKEHSYFSKDWNSNVITNISEPSILIYQPKPQKNTGTTVIIAPGGALYALSMINEGKNVANWLTEKGITAVILKYRLIPTNSKDGIQEYKITKKQNPNKIQENVNKVIPYAINDALTAISYMRSHAKEYHILPNKIGFMGFSAGGAVTMGVAYNYTVKNRPDFLVPVYPWTSKYPVQKPKKDAPPIIIFCASNDPLKLALGSIDLYKSWKESGLNAALHMYAKGGHGFGLKPNKLPCSSWIDRFYEWAIDEKLIILKK